MAVPEPAALLAAFFVAALPFFFECPPDHDKVGLIRTYWLFDFGGRNVLAQFRGGDFYRGRLLGGTCHEPLSLLQKFRALTNFLANFAASLPKGNPR